MWTTNLTNYANLALASFENNYEDACQAYSYHFLSSFSMSGA